MPPVSPGPSGSGSRYGGQPASLLAINVRYFAVRVAMFGVVLAAVLVLGVDGLLAFALAVVLSGLASYPLAVRQRRAVVDAVEARRGRLR
jgi:hypothetical protein